MPCCIQLWLWHTSYASQGARPLTRLACLLCSTGRRGGRGRAAVDYSELSGMGEWL